MIELKNNQQIVTWEQPVEDMIPEGNMLVELPGDMFVMAYIADDNKNLCDVYSGMTATGQDWADVISYAMLDDIILPITNVKCDACQEYFPSESIKEMMGKNWCPACALKHAKVVEGFL